MLYTLGGASLNPHPQCTLVPSRRAVSELSLEELRRELLTSHLTGLSNRRAFEEDQERAPAAAIAMLDVDGLKAVNDLFGHEAGDELLRVFASCLPTQGVEAYHLSGDEFLITGASMEAVTQAIGAARRAFGAARIHSGAMTLAGAGFSAGVGAGANALPAAMLDLCSNKAERETQGLRKRGALCGLMAA